MIISEEESKERIDESNEERRDRVHTSENMLNASREFIIE